MIVVDKEILIDQSTLLFHDTFFDGWERNWEITGGEWKAENGVLTGIYRGNAGGIIYTKQCFDGDVMLDFYGMIIPPCSNDMNCTWRAKGWNFEVGDADVGYIAGINGWWHSYTGIERYPQCSPRALSQAFRAEPGVEYHINAGIIGGQSFIAVDGNVIVILSEDDPINDPECGRVGLGTYCSQIAFRDFKVYRPTWKEAETNYTPEF